VQILDLEEVQATMVSHALYELKQAAADKAEQELAHLRDKYKVLLGRYTTLKTAIEQGIVASLVHANAESPSAWKNRLLAKREMRTSVLGAAKRGSMPSGACRVSDAIPEESEAGEGSSSVGTTAELDREIRELAGEGSVSPKARFARAVMDMQVMSHKAKHSTKASTLLEGTDKPKLIIEALLTKVKLALLLLCAS
jgi:hypothetical protein